MQYVFVKKAVVKICLLAFICLAAFINPAKAGMDYYKIFLGKKLIYERFVDKPLNLESLPISAEDAGEMLTIHYYQCHTPNGTGSNRTIALKDEKGNTVKQWTFADAKGKNTGMTIPVKELLQWQAKSKSSALALYYTAEGRTEGEKLTAIQTASKAVTCIHQENELLTQMTKQVINLLFKNLVVG